MKKAVLSLVLLLCLSCNKEARFDDIKNGMKVEEVVKLVGEPTKQQDAAWLGKWYFYEKHIIVFVNDTVTKVQTIEEFKDKMSGFTEGLDKLNNENSK